MAAVPTMGSNALKYGSAAPKRMPTQWEEWERRQQELNAANILDAKKRRRESAPCAKRGSRNKYEKGTANLRFKSYR